MEISSTPTGKTEGNGKEMKRHNLGNLRFDSQEQCTRANTTDALKKYSSQWETIQNKYDAIWPYFVDIFELTPQ